MKDILVIDCKDRERYWINLKSNHRMFFATTAYEGLNLLSESVGLIFFNLNQLESGDMEMLRLIKKAYPTTEIVMISSCDTEETCTKGSIKDDHCSGADLNASDILQTIRTIIHTDNTHKGLGQSVMPVSSDDASRLPNIPSHLVGGILKVRDFIVQNYSESITLNDACKMASTSKTYFCRYFKSVTGHSLRNYHHVVKVRMARDLLRDKRLSIADIAIQLGYNDSNYFSAIYKKITGVSPKYHRGASQNYNATQ
jgi:AraC-like DNA-binding protein